MRTIRLEILRHGPPHNQLLSPLTTYLALCENHEAVTIRLPFKHAEFLRRLNTLQYGSGDADFRAADLNEVGEWMAEILEQIPELREELAKANQGSDGHVELVLGGNELALLPFEVTHAPGLRGHSMFLQGNRRICVTRRLRSAVANGSPCPQRRPRILFAFAAPSASLPTNVFDRHLRALRDAIAPWLYYWSDASECDARTAEHLTVLDQATIGDIRGKCSSGEFTHVHIVGHGVTRGGIGDRRYGLGLHSASDPSQTDVVDGGRLAQALRSRTGESPSVVTLAACDSANVGAVISAGASIAHALHEDGIPLVIASQFPLSIEGSIIMADILYHGLLAGEDPRILLIRLREELKAQVADTHDWGSIVCYGTFPQDSDRQFQHFGLQQALRRVEAAINHADKTAQPNQKQLAEAYDELVRLRREMRDASEYGKLAGSEKRLAQMVWRIGDSAAKKEAEKWLNNAYDNYREAFNRDRTQAWALVQALALARVLRIWDADPSTSMRQWEMARVLSEDDLKADDPEHRTWARANLIELFLIAPNKGSDRWAEAERRVPEFNAEARRDSFEVHSTKRQLLRYKTFFAEVNPDLKDVAEQAAKIASMLPTSAYD